MALPVDVASSPPLPDIANRDDLRIIVDSFYDRVREDELLGFIFDKVANIDWETHLPKMVDFWETVLFGTGAYKGNPLRPHLEVSTQTDIGSAQFERWKELFFATVDSRFSGERAEHIKAIAADMARVMLSRITGEPMGMSFAPDAPRPETP